VAIPPNQRLIIRRSSSEAAISAEEPESVSSSSAVTTRFIEGQSSGSSRRSSVLTLQPTITLMIRWRLKTAARRLLLHFCQFFFQQLFVVEVAVVTIPRYQFLVSAQFHDPAGMENGDPVGVPHRRNPM
jgi:hypothetical protein